MADMWKLEDKVYNFQVLALTIVQGKVYWNNRAVSLKGKEVLAANRFHQTVALLA